MAVQDLNLVNLHQIQDVPDRPERKSTEAWKYVDIGVGDAHLPICFTQSQKKYMQVIRLKLKEVF